MLKSKFRTELLIAATAAALIAGTAIASAQGMRDDPPGSRFQSEQDNQEMGAAYDGDHMAEPRGAHAETRKGQCWFSTAWGMYGGHWGPCEGGGSPSR